jgi:subtilisin-like proprotein convertase family protein
MKNLCTAVLLALLGMTGTSRAATYTFNFSNGFANTGTVPDGNATGWSDTRTLSGIADGSILDLDVSLDIAGGYNGDLYIYLTHDSGFSILLNRVGRTSANPFGYSNAGLNVTFDDAAANGDVHLYQNVIGYSALISNGNSWTPDGRNVNPLMTLDSDTRTQMLSAFNGGNPNGSWTLFVADLSGGSQATVVNWGLTVTAVPEPSSCVIAMAGGLALFFRRIKPPLMD